MLGKLKGRGDIILLKSWKGVYIGGQFNFSDFTCAIRIVLNI